MNQQSESHNHTFTTRHTHREDHDCCVNEAWRIKSMRNFCCFASWLESQNVLEELLLYSCCSFYCQNSQRNLKNFRFFSSLTSKWLRHIIFLLHKSRRFPRSQNHATWWLEKHHKSASPDKVVKLHFKHSSSGCRIEFPKCAQSYFVWLQYWWEINCFPIPPPFCQRSHPTRCLTISLLQSVSDGSSS